HSIPAPSRTRRATDVDGLLAPRPPSTAARPLGFCIVVARRQRRLGRPRRRRLRHIAVVFAHDRRRFAYGRPPLWCRRVPLRLRYGFAWFKSRRLSLEMRRLFEGLGCELHFFQRWRRRFGAFRRLLPEPLAAIAPAAAPPTTAPSALAALSRLATFAISLTAGFGIPRMYDPFCFGECLGAHFAKVLRRPIVSLAALAASAAPAPAAPATAPAAALARQRRGLLDQFFGSFLRLCFLSEFWRDRIWRDAVRGRRRTRARNRTAFDRKILLAGKRRVRLDQDRCAKMLLELTQMRALVVEHVERNVRARPHNEIVRGALHQLVFDRAQ